MSMLRVRLGSHGKFIETILSSRSFALRRIYVDLFPGETNCRGAVWYVGAFHRCENFFESESWSGLWRDCQFFVCLVYSVAYREGIVKRCFGINIFIFSSNKKYQKYVIFIRNTTCCTVSLVNLYICVLSSSTIELLTAIWKLTPLMRCPESFWRIYFCLMFASKSSWT